jgi:tetratricopeptide (TPR) repeat protein
MARAGSGRIVAPLWQVLVIGVICLGVGCWIGRASVREAAVEIPETQAPPSQAGLTAHDAEMLRQQIETTNDYATLVQIGHHLFDAAAEAQLAGGDSPEVRLGIAAYEKALSINGADPDLWTDLGALYSDRAGDQTRAVACFRKALAIDHGHAKAHFNLGIATLRGTGDFAAAKREFAEYVRLAPNGDEAGRAQRFLASSGETIREMVQSDRGQGRLEEAEHELRAAMKVDPGNSEDWYWLGVVLIHQEKLADGLKAWQEYEKRAPNGAKMATVRQMRPNIQGAMAQREGG